MSQDKKDKRVHSPSNLPRQTDNTAGKPAACDMKETRPRMRPRRDPLAGAASPDSSLLQTIMENTGAHLAYLDLDFRYIRVNAAFARSCGYTIGELVGKNHFTVLSSPATLAIFQKARDTVEPQTYEMKTFVPGRPPGDNVTHWDCNLVPVRDATGKVQGLVLSLVDITPLKRAEEKLLQSEATYRRLVESAPDGIVSLDLEGTIKDCNEWFCQFVGSSYADTVGKHIKTFLLNMTSADLVALYDRILMFGTADAEFDMLGRDDTVVTMWAKMSILPTGDAPPQFVAYIRDISERKKLDQLKDEFAGMVSHEMRTPLTVITGGLHTVISEWPRMRDSEKRSLIKDAATESEALAGILENLLELARVQAKRLALAREPVDMAGLVTGIIRKLKAQSEHAFALDFPDDFPRLNVDRVRMERVIHNLVQNAVKYSRPGTTIRIFGRREKQGPVVGVSDQGIGITLSDQSRLFSPFQRLEPRNGTSVKGTGLGLLVCKRLLEAHDGRIWVESEPDKGSTFLFMLPLDTCVAKTAAAGHNLRRPARRLMAPPERK